MVRTTALRLLVSVLDRFPSAQLDVGCLSILLDVLEALASKSVVLNAADVARARGATESSPLVLPGCPYVVEAPSSAVALTAILTGMAHAHTIVCVLMCCVV